MKPALVILAAVLALAAAGCKKKLTFADKKVHSIELGGFTAPVPDGWRDIAEIKDEALKASFNLTGNARAILPEAVSDKGFQPNIVFTAASGDGLGANPDACRILSEGAMKAQPTMKIRDVVASSFDGDPGCRWAIDAGSDATGTVLVRFHDDQLYLVQCLWSAKGDPQAARACDQVIAGIKRISAPR